MMKPATAPIGFGRVLQVLGYTADDHVGIFTKDINGRVDACTLPTRHAVRYRPEPGVNAYYGVNPVKPMPPGRRGTNDDVTRIVAVYADLDVKPGAFTNLDAAKATAAEIGITIGTCARITVESGGGLHAIWPLASPIAASQLPRWHQLVRQHAARRDAAVDNIADPARVLRMPGSLNYKFDPPAPCRATEHAHGHPVDVWTLNTALDAVAPMKPVDPVAGDTAAAPTAWEWAEDTCPFMSTFIRTVVNDTPTARHPWLLSQYVRLTAAVANGCITRDDHRTAVDRINNRMRVLVGMHPARRYDPDEITGAQRKAIEVVALKSPTAIADELGGHLHTNPIHELLKGRQ